jgi:hypothetical protein
MKKTRKHLVHISARNKRATRAHQCPFSRRNEASSISLQVQAVRTRLSPVPPRGRPPAGGRHTFLGTQKWTLNRSDDISSPKADIGWLPIKSKQKKGATTETKTGQRTNDENQTHPLAKIRAGNGRRLRQNRRRPWPWVWVDAGTDLRPMNAVRSGRPSAVRRRECWLSGAWAPCRSAAATGRGPAPRNPPVSRRQTAPCETDEITHVVNNLFICHPQTVRQSCQGYYLAPGNLTAGNLKSSSNCGSLNSTLSGRKGKNKNQRSVYRRRRRCRRADLTGIQTYQTTWQSYKSGNPQTGDSSDLQK